MSDEMRPYVVRQGDYLEKLAFVRGFDAEEVWSHAKNDEVRGKRPDHNILAPGDIVYLPVKKKVGLPIAKGVVNRYVARVPKIEIVIAFKDGDGKALANEPCEVLGLGAARGADPLKVDGDGKLTLNVPVTMSEVSVHFMDRNILYRIQIGDMDPLSEASGIRKRLNNLGFWHVDPELDADEKTALLLKSFQAKFGLNPTGVLDEATQSALTDNHGL